MALSGPTTKASNVEIEENSVTNQSRKFLSIFDFEMIVCVSSELGDSARLLDYSV